MSASAQRYTDHGFDALGKAEWLRAKQCFEQALQAARAPEAYDGLGIACWWLNDIRAAHHYRTLAYNEFRQAGDVRRAVVIACWLGREQVFLDSNVTAMQGWFARADSLLQTLPPCAERAWCRLLRASMLATSQALEQIALESIEAGRAFYDSRLEAFALAYCGLAQINQSRIDDGMRRLDEAMIMTTNGELRDFMVTSEIFCVMLSACEIAGDLVRSEQWCQKAWAFAEEYHCPYLSAYCRTTYGSILYAMGRWQEAEDTLTQAIRAFEQGHRGLRLHALIRLAGLRVHQSRLDEARLLLDGLQDQESAALPLAQLHLAKGEIEVAKALLEHSLRACPPYTLQHLPNLALLVEVLLAADDKSALQSQLAHLADLARQAQSSQLLAQADLVKGRVYLHLGELAQAKQCFALAMEQVQAFQQSLIAGQIRLNMARTLVDTDSPGAIVWAKAALATFERIQAAHDAATARGLLRALGAGGVSMARSPALLTQRELEIAKLVSQGLTNREISQHLVISIKTVEHHVSQILNKLDVRSRTEIATFIVLSNPTE